MFCLREISTNEQPPKKYGYADQRGVSYKVPDARFQLRTAKGTYRVALELEIAQKSRQRYRNLLKRSMLSRDCDVVFLVVAEERILAKMETLIQDLKEQDVEVRIAKNLCGMYFAPLSKVLAQRERCTFIGEGKSFSLADLAAEIDAGSGTRQDEVFVTRTSA